MDFNEAFLHEATFNLHTHKIIFYRLSIASVDGKQHLSEVVFSALRVFENRILRRIFGPKRHINGELRRLHIEELHLI